ncbi:MAG TPA: zinc ribbon domain-containing protein [Syntrophorhabdaceae bacterium]|nr:zinc ribbon domain-containing protein [Syntrophorhabdaceae bacterium]HQM81021.1 zinc ribbon domain-containing protein [Syntrophorhabdaceae bacterium]
MPIYEYECTECGEVFEIFQKISEEPITECPKCTGAMQKIISPCAFHLKGTGWYATDYKKTADSVNGKNGKKHTEKKEEKTETATEVKTETKSETTQTGTAGG